MASLKCSCAATVISSRSRWSLSGVSFQLTMNPVIPADLGLHDLVPDDAWVAAGVGADQRVVFLGPVPGAVAEPLVVSRRTSGTGGDSAGARCRQAGPDRRRLGSGHRQRGRQGRGEATGCDGAAQCHGPWRPGCAAASCFRQPPCAGDGQALCADAGRIPAPARGAAGQQREADHRQRPRRPPGLRGRRG